jgi:methylmalonyl-CoA/ethylmalonyl-CoA epimerase
MQIVRDLREKDTIIVTIKAFHHIGVACRDLNFEAEKFAILGYIPEGGIFCDPIQGVEGMFLVGGGPRLEILKPLSSKGVLTPWLKSGTKLYHLAYSVGDDMQSEIEKFRRVGAKVVVQPVNAIAFSGAKICFLMLPNMLLVELIGA